MLCSGFELLATPPSTVAESIKALGKELQASGVAAEPGLLFTAAPRVALLSRADIVSRWVLLLHVLSQV